MANCDATLTPAFWLQKCIDLLYRHPDRLDVVLEALCEPIADRNAIKFLRTITAVELRNKQEHYSLFIPGIDAYQ